MSLIVNKTCGKLTAILSQFYDAGLAPPSEDLEILEATGLPEPYRGLLVHDRDMTSTLTAYHGEELQLRVLDKILDEDVLSRHVVLETVASGRPVEYGAAQIQLGLLSQPARDEVVEARRPLGGILNRHEVCYKSCPGAFFRVAPTPLIEQVFELREPRWLFGRCNCLSDRRGRSIAEVVEILPP